jgi:hypothetical protein
MREVWRLKSFPIIPITTCSRHVRSGSRGTRASERVDLEVCFSGPFEGGWAGSILKCLIVRNFLTITIYLSNHAWQYGMTKVLKAVGALSYKTGHGLGPGACIGSAGPLRVSCTTICSTDWLAD